MRSVNLAVMFAVALISALLGSANLLVGVHPNRLPLMASLLGLLLISLAYALLLLNHTAKGLGGHLLILALYMASAAAGFAACGSLGLVPYTMQSQGVGLFSALDYVWRAVLICGVIAVVPYLLAIVYLRRQRAALRALPDQ